MPQTEDMATRFEAALLSLDRLEAKAVQKLIDG